LASTFRRSIRTKAHEKFWRKGSVGISRDCPNFLCTPYYLRNRKSYGFQIWPVHLEGPSEQKHIKNFREKGAWAYPGTAQFFRIPLIISGTGKATNFKSSQYIQRVHPNKSPLKFFGEKGVWANPGTAQIFCVPPISREQVKLRTLNFACTFIGSIGTKAH